MNIYSHSFIDLFYLFISLLIWIKSNLKQILLTIGSAGQQRVSSIKPQFYYFQIFIK